MVYNWLFKFQKGVAGEQVCKSTGVFSWATFFSSIMFPPSNSRQDSNAPIRLTDADAALARLSAVQKGYLQDPFVKHLVPRAHLQPPRPPLINVGTYVRSSAIDKLVEGWLLLAEQENKQCQIVSLGAGSDTRFWRIAVGRTLILLLLTLLIFVPSQDPWDPV